MVPYIKRGSRAKDQFGDGDINAEFVVLMGLPRINVQ